MQNYTTVIEKTNTCHFCDEMIEGKPVYLYGRPFCNLLCEELSEEINQSKG